ncbi:MULTISPECIES: hypothetical protein [Streptomyces]|uniref:Peptidase inhibitor family I36 n=1 Tax=Streptomyces lasiicapitis TaxID=1923961 RepID=A0ABQ2LR11_9ACTN|nr:MULTISPECIES: hypothetical protein [Streptomyces]QIB47572.1 hypothetical protein G3H79_35345 [Streptomyces aureoverticillatus]GGO42254.1 hypothetical protein GCM10012286_23370 [Streptomyces lasiicapitis]
MSYRRNALRIALTCALAIGLTGLSQTGGGARSSARATAEPGIMEPACPPPGGGTCYFEYYDDAGRRGIEFSPEVGRCYNMSSAGSVRGTNMTSKRVHLWPSSDCVGGATALVDPGFSWNDRSHYYYSFRPIR